MTYAQITAGAVHGSQQLTVSTTAPAATLVLIYRGLFLLGQATTTSSAQTNLAVPLLYPLAEGDMVQASLTERGGGCEPAVRVSAAPAPTGWINPLTVTVKDPVTGVAQTISRAAYITQFGEQPAPIYDASLLVPPINFPGEFPGEAAALAITAASTAIIFGIDTTQIPGSVTVTITSLTNAGAGALIRSKLGAGVYTAWTNDLARTFTTSGTVTLQVKRATELDAQAITRTVAIIVPAAPVAATSDIEAAAYRLFRGTADTSPFFYVNSPSQPEIQMRPLSGSVSAWMLADGYDYHYYEKNWGNLTPGFYIAAIRNVGSTDPAREYLLPFTILPY